MTYTALLTRIATIVKRSNPNNRHLFADSSLTTFIKDYKSTDQYIALNNLPINPNPLDVKDKLFEHWTKHL